MALNGMETASRGASTTTPFSRASSRIERPSGVSSASEAIMAARSAAASGTPGAGITSVAMRLPKVMVPVLSSSRGVHVARRLHRPAGGGQHVELQQPVHAGDAYGREQAPYGRGDQADEQGAEHDGFELHAGIAAEPHQRHHHDQEHQRQPRQQHGQRDLVGRLPAVGAFDHGDHAVEEAGAGAGGHAYLQPIGHHRGAAGDGGAVPAALPDHRRALAGNGGLVDAGHALHDLAVGRDHVAGLHQDHVAYVQLAGGGGDGSPGLGIDHQLGLCVDTCGAKAVGGGLAPPLPPRSRPGWRTGRWPKARSRSVAESRSRGR